MTTPTVDLIKYFSKGSLLTLILWGMYYLVLHGNITAQALYSMVGPLVSVLIGHQLGYQQGLGQNSSAPPKS